MERAGRRLRQATYGGADAGAIRFYTDAVGTLSNAFDRFESGELNDNSLETRNILREFARFSPRADSPTAAMSMEEMADELRRYERSRRALDGEEALQLRGGNAMEVDEADGENQPMDVDLNLNGIHNNDRVVGPEDPGVEYGPLNFDDQILADIHAQRVRVLAEIEDHLLNAQTHEDVWYWEAQPDWWYAVP